MKSKKIISFPLTDRVVLSKVDKQRAPTINTKEDLLKFTIIYKFFLNSKQSKRSIREFPYNSSHWVGSGNVISPTVK